MGDELPLIEFLDVDDLLYKQKGKSNISPAGNINVTNVSEKTLLVISNNFGVVIWVAQKGIGAVKFFILKTFLNFYRILCCENRQHGQAN
jgi:hypothetical protein